MKYLRLLRVKQWIKNILILLPIVCSHNLNRSTLLNSSLAFASFCLISSFVYIINDIKDAENDRKNNSKKNRPIANKEISIKKAIIISIILLVLGLSLTIYIKGIDISLYILLSYIIINILYSFGMKNIVIIDVVILSICYIIRVYYGASIFDIEVSNWLFLTIINSSLFLGLNKRKKEYINNKSTRKVLSEYNENFLDRFSYLTLTLTLVFYSLWAMEQTSKYMIYTVPILMIIFMKYSLNIEKNEDGDPTSVLYSDKVLMILAVIYIIIMGALFI